MRREVLVILELRKLGDAILSLPFVRGAKLHYDVYVLCHPASAPIFQTQLPTDHILKLTPPWVQFNAGSLLAFVRSVRQVRLLRPDVIVCGWADARVEWLMGLIRAPRRVGFPMTPRNYYACQVPWRRRHLRHGQWLSWIGKILTGSRLLTDPLSRRDVAQSHLSDWAQVGEAVGVVPDTTIPWLKVSQEIRDPLLEAVLAQCCSRRRPLWIVHPGAGSRVKQWGKGRFEKLIQSFFIPKGITVVVIQSPGDLPLDVAGASVVLYKPPALESLIAITSMADAVLCNDSAMSHLAAAMGKRVVAIFGPSDPRLFSPFGNEHNVVVKGDCVWRPCMDRCLMPSPFCMELIHVEDVAEKVQRVHEELQQVFLENRCNGNV